MHYILLRNDISYRGDRVRSLEYLVLDCPGEIRCVGDEGVGRVRDSEGVLTWGSVEAIWLCSFLGADFATVEAWWL